MDGHQHLRKFKTLKYIALLLTLAIAACTNSVMKPSEPAAPVMPSDGSWTVAYTMLEGDCNPTVTGLVTIKDGTVIENESEIEEYCVMHNHTQDGMLAYTYECTFGEGFGTTETETFKTVSPDLVIGESTIVNEGWCTSTYKTFWTKVEMPEAPL